jgi:PAS domain S-box-containing protein
MGHLLKRVWDYMVRDEILSLQERLYRLTCLVISVISLLVILPVNLVLGLPQFLNLADVALGLFSLYCYRESCRGRNHFAGFFLVLLVLMDLAWFPNAGSQGSVTFYFFIGAVLPMTLSRGWVRRGLILLLVVNLCGLFLLEYFFPWLATPFGTPADRLIDLLSGAFCGILACALLLGVVISNYDWEHAKTVQVSRNLAVSEKNYREVVECAHAIILRVDRQGRVTFFNRYAEQLFGYQRQKIMGRELAGILSPDPAKPDDVIKTALAKLVGQPGPEARGESECACQDGRRLWISWIFQPIHDDRQEWLEILCLGENITERKQAEARRQQEEQQMRHVQKLESLGILAGGIAHDFNNVLTAILGNISLARLGLKPGANEHELLREAEKAAIHARDLTAQLLTFSKGGQPIKTAVALDPVIRDAASFALRGSRSKADLRLAPGLWPVEADAVQLGQVFHNLLVNAHQAMPQGGLVQVQAANRTIAPAETAPIPEGHYVEIHVQDQGMGIPEEVLPRIFDPYYTTKNTGSGLGLAVVFSVLKNHRGHISAQSKVGVGTTFTLLLPASAQTVAPKAASAETLRPGAGRILVLDDEEMVSKTMARMLKRLGFEATCVSDGLAAIASYQEATASGQPFDAVIMDLTIPGGMGGQEAVKRLRQLDPQVRAIVSSGYSSDPIMSEYAAHGFAAVMAKPYTAQTLKTVLDQVLTPGLHR